MSKHTQVELLWLKRQIANRIRCSRTAEEHILDVPPRPPCSYRWN